MQKGCTRTTHFEGHRNSVLVLNGFPCCLAVVQDTASRSKRSADLWGLHTDHLWGHWGPLASVGPLGSPGICGATRVPSHLWALGFALGKVSFFPCQSLGRPWQKQCHQKNASQASSALFSWPPAHWGPGFSRLGPPPGNTAPCSFWCTRLSLWWKAASLLHPLPSRCAFFLPF